VIDDVRFDGWQDAGWHAVVGVGLPDESVLWLIERTTTSFEEVQTEALDTKCRTGNILARKSIRLISLLSRITNDEFHNAIWFIGSTTTKIHTETEGFREFKVRIIRTTGRGEFV